MEAIGCAAENIYGFRLTGRGSSMNFFCLTEFARNNWMERLKRVCVLTNIHQFYGIGKIIGCGSFAKVHIGNRKIDDREFAIKSITKKRIMESNKNVTLICNEIKALRLMSHPNIIKLYEVYEDSVYIHLVMEYIKGGELFKYLQSKGAYTEKDASLAIKNVLEALKYSHGLNIVHRDLKAENLLLS
eukprot:TRINITY_DN11053_c0_g1_i3.p1 TRINITY_DN11053_c0_g1~~TRINITY_DN11053_c0_g1_i3.p1  ORF type:complete len:187 (-),score=44.12 TRINITY_DN11053_c0_g1_i3:243-803(-)